MSNILIIKHGSLGDLIQANGAIEDIKNAHGDSKVLLLTSTQYVNFMSSCPYIDGVLEDKRLPRWNLKYLFKLKKLLNRYKFTKIFDLQNSSRTRFYRRFLLNNTKWSSTDTVLKKNQKKSDFDNDPVLDRIEIQLNISGVETNNVKNINLEWSFVNIEKLIEKYNSKKYILIFPFCSKKHPQKKWPYFQKLIEELKHDYNDRYNFLIAPGPGEIEESKKICKDVVLDESSPVNLNQLIALIKKSAFIIANDTGPAHIASHLKKRGLVLFGSHTSPKKVSIENNSFKSIIVSNLNNLSVETVKNTIRNNLD